MMLKQRVITALVLLAILLPALFYPTPTPFIFLALIFMSAAAWEWARLNGVASANAVAHALVFAAVCAGTWYAGWTHTNLPWLWAAAGALWVLASGWLVRAGVVGWPRIAQPVRLLGGLVGLWLAWLAVSQARVIGIGFLLSLLLLVWVADIFAYFAGRGLGGQFVKNKLAPTISPGKTWEGVWGGLIGVVLLALIWLHFFSGDTFFSRMATRHGALLMVLAVVFLAAMSVVGDLVESLIKRSAGAKDSSNLLPGHGGVLDRIDALLPTLPLALMLLSI